MRNVLPFLALATTALIACSGNIASATAMPAPAPLLSCSARISDGSHHATLAILFAPSAAAAPAAPGALVLTPSSITLTASHPAARVAVRDSGYSGRYAITFIDCAGYLDVRWPNRSTLIITL
jgi:hypothetical protein